MTETDVPAPKRATVGSLFAGIGGIDLGLERAGLTVAWQCEKDDAARRVLARHWPSVPCYDDVTTLKGPDVPRVDVLCGGFPCQDLSVAGRRAGLAGERSGLFHEFMRLAAELAPRWLLIENVLGLLSSNEGADMGVVLDTLADLGYGWCYRVLDAQYIGVAQRRRRVFIVGCAGDPRRAGEVLLDPGCCDGNPPPRRQAGQKVAATLGSLASGGFRTTDLDGIGSFIVNGEAYPLQCVTETERHQNGDGIGAADAPSYTIDGMSRHGVAYALAMRGRDDGAELEMGEEGVYNALRAGDGGSSRQNLVAYRKAQKAHDPDDCERWEEADVLDTITSHSTTSAAAVVEGMTVRRLMPIECERLQGFPDGWTAGETDSARYRLLGNAVCVSVAAWIGRRIMEATGGSNGTS